MNDKAVQHVAFLRAINVGGHAVVKMTDLREAFVAAGCRNVRTYIASGNVLFEAAPAERDAVCKRIRASVGRLLGAETNICFRTVPELARLVQSDPFGVLRDEPGIKLYVAFLADKPRTRLALPQSLPKERLEAIAIKGREIFVVSRRKPNGFYGFPNTFVEALGVTATTRNWSTVTKIVAFARAEKASP